MIFFRSLLLALMLVGCSSKSDTESENNNSTAGTPEQQQSIISAAENVVALMDKNQMGAVWDLSGPMLRNRTSKTTFVTGIFVLRSPLGSPGERKVAGFNFSNKLEGFTGDFGMIFITTDFENAKEVEEQFVFQKIDGKWKIIGYFISKTYTIIKPVNTPN